MLISHDHYDHLDMETVKALGRRGSRFLAPLGVGAHLEKWGIAPARISELDWGERQSHRRPYARRDARRGISRVAASAARDATLWCSWVIAGPAHRVFYSGDSGYFEGFREIGAEYGPFDATLMSAGAYGPTWPDIHMNPEELVRAHVDLGGGLLVPIHWATFNLAFHAWNEPGRAPRRPPGNSHGHRVPSAGRDARAFDRARLRTRGVVAQALKPPRRTPRIWVGGRR